jgi:cation-transporting ATPase I
MIATVLGINAVVGGVQRVQTDRALAGLVEHVRTSVRVRRGGQGRLVSSDDLAPGDIVSLHSGDTVPADCRILDSVALEVDESSLTGESLPVRKRAKATAATVVADRRSMLYEGTTVAAGEVTAVVVAIGASTEAGRAVHGAQGRAPTGVEQRLSSLTTQTIPLSLIGGAAVATAGALRRRPIGEILGTGVGLAVAAVPEGLPVLATVAQLSAARRLSARGALVRNPRTIEALGRVDVLCIDKTGTLTEGKIRLRQVTDLARSEPVEALTGARRGVLAAALRASPTDNGQTLPHPTDRAVIEGAAAAAVTLTANGQPGKRIADLPFEPARGFHAAVHKCGASSVLSVKGAPEVVLPRCATRRMSGATTRLGKDDRRQLDAEVERLARQGFRVLVVAEREWDKGTNLREGDVVDLELRGLLALADPVRVTAAQALAEIQRAGVAVAMITGDHPSTAQAVASELEMLNGGRVVTGAELDRMDDATLDAELSDVTVYARVTPTHKVRIVQALQRTGRTVAMTGDGANDAPAIRLADVGVALGGAGAIPAARSAADVVIADDRVETLIDAVVEGRAMWASVRDALSILLGGNLGEICYGVTGGLLSHTPVMNARQLLLVNLLTDMAPATVIALRPPRNTSPETLLREGPEASLGSALTRDVWLRAVTTASAATAAWLVARATGRGARARTVGLVALVSAQLGQTMVAGGHSPLVFVTGTASFMVLTVVVQTPGVSQFFGCTPLGPVGWAIAGTSASLATAASVIGSHLTSDGKNDKEEEIHVSQVETPQAERTNSDQTEETKEQVQEAKESGRQLGRTARLLLSETAYATLGVGGYTADLVRRTPATLRTLNHKTASGVRTVSGQMYRGLISLARRGHTMVGSAPLETRESTTADNATEDAVRDEPSPSVEEQRAPEQMPAAEPARSTEPNSSSMSPPPE